MRTLFPQQMIACRGEPGKKAWPQWSARPLLRRAVREEVAEKKFYRVRSRLVAQAAHESTRQTEPRKSVGEFVWESLPPQGIWEAPR